MHRAADGLSPAACEVRDDTSAAVSSFGDLLFYLEGKLAELKEALTDVDIADVVQVVTRFCGHDSNEGPGVEPEDLARLLKV